MTYYLLYLYSSVIAIFLNFTSNKNSRNILFAILFLMYSLFAGLRNNVGVDFMAYFELFESIKLNNSDLYFEFLNIKIAELFYSIGMETQFIFLFYSSITVYFFIKYIKYFSSNYYLSFLIFLSFGMFYLASFNQVRQYLALAIFLYSLKYIIKKEFITYSLLIVMASLIHLSALVLLPLYFILNKKISTSGYLLICGVYLFALSFLESILSYTPYAFYLNTTMFDRESSNALLYIFIFINILIILFRNRVLKIFSFANLFINMAFFSTLLMISTIVSSLPSMIFIRINNYFIPYLIIIVALYFTALKDKNLKAIYIIGISVIAFMYFVYTIEVNGTRYNLVPFKININLF